jgi:hypothetical protein
VNGEKIKWRRENNDFCRETGEAPAAWLLEGATPYTGTSVSPCNRRDASDG